jgi:hypothetical protein
MSINKLLMSSQVLLKGLLKRFVLLAQLLEFSSLLVLERMSLL